MIETWMSALGVVFTPTIIDSMNLPASYIFGYFYYWLFIILITTIINMIRAYRYCKKGKNSWGVEYGYKKGALCGGVAVATSIVTGFIPPLKLPFMILSFIPFIGGLVDGFIMALGYMISYMMMAYPIWGSC